MNRSHANTARASERTVTPPRLPMLKVEAAPPAGEQLLKAMEVAARLAVTTRHISNLVKRGRFPQPVRLGCSVRWRSSDVELFISVGGDMDRFEAESKR